jgi:hypothetical protein
MTWRHIGTVTDLRVIKSVIEQLIEEGDAIRITVAEGKTWRMVDSIGTPVDQTYDGWTYHWPHYGNLSYHDMLYDLDTANPNIQIDYIDLDYPPYTVDVPVPGGGLSLDYYTVPDVILNCDKLIAVAVMKDHTSARVTLTNKLFIGTSPATVYGNSHPFNHKGVPHEDKLERTIIDLVSFHPPDFGIVECIWGTQGGGPLGGSPIKRNVVLAGNDNVAVDAASAYAMGMNPWDIDHLHWAHNKGFGNNDLDYIDIVGPSLDDIRYEFGKTIFDGRCCRNWLLNGTFSGSDIDFDYLGDEPLASPVIGDPGWEVINGVIDYIDLSNHYGGPSSCISYAFTRIISDAAKTVNLRFGSDDGIKIWLNGTAVYSNGSTGSWSLVEQSIPVNLIAGENRLLIKIKNSYGDYGFSARVSETDGDTPLDIDYSLIPLGNPIITLDAPPNGADMAGPEVSLSAWFDDSDLDPLNISFYGGKTADASELLYCEENVAAGTYVVCNWSAQTLEADANTVALYHFDEGSGNIISDASSNGLDGFWWCDSTLDSAWTTDAAFGYALHFYGLRLGGQDTCNADWVEVPDALELNFAAGDPISIEFWIKPDYIPTDRNIGLVSKGPHSDPADSMNSGGPANYEVNFLEITQTLGFYNGNLYQCDSMTLTAGEWQYIAVTLAEDGELRFYKNGVLWEIYPDSVAVGPMTWEPLRIGCSAYAMKAVPGIMDEVRISNTVRESAEIANNYKLGVENYYWRAEADDGSKTMIVSETRQFTLVADGPDTIPPVITLVSPNDGYSTNDHYIELEASVYDETPTAIRVYGSTASDPSDLLYIEAGIPGTNAINYMWDAPRLTNETGFTMGLWHLDGGSGSNIIDAGDNGNNGSIVGDARWSTDGKFGHAIEFDGSGCGLSIPDDNSLDVGSTGALTVEAWIYPYSVGGGNYRTIVAKRYTTVNYQVSLNAADGNLLFYNGNISEIKISDVTVSANTWSYIAVTVDATSGDVIFYLDGVPGDTLTGASFGIANDNPLCIGVKNDSLGQPFYGRMDEVRLTNHVLSASEIAGNYELDVGFYYWKVMAEDSGDSTTTSTTRQFSIGDFNCSPGEVNGSDPINIFDITYLIKYLYLDGPAPNNRCSGDPNCDCSVNIFDITYLITFLYLDGPAPCNGQNWIDACGVKAN